MSEWWLLAAFVAGLSAGALVGWQLAWAFAENEKDKL